VDDRTVYCVQCQMYGYNVQFSTCTVCNNLQFTGKINFVNYKLQLQYSTANLSSFYALLRLRPKCRGEPIQLCFWRRCSPSFPTHHQIQLLVRVDGTKDGADLWAQRATVIEAHCRVDIQVRIVFVGHTPAVAGLHVAARSRPQS
jgi:hypothetical protein